MRADSRPLRAAGAPHLARYRLGVASRLVAAALGGHALSVVVAHGVASALWGGGASRIDSVMAATMMAFLSHALAALWAFGCASAWRAWCGIGATGLAFCALAAGAAWSGA